MTQAPGGPHNGPDGELACQAGNSESTDGGRELAQRIWGRYGGSPGVIPMGGTLAIARHASHFGTGRLPLLADVYRRWGPAAATFPAAWSALPHARPPAFIGASPYAALSASETPLHHFGPASLTARTERAGSPRPTSALSAGERVRSDRPIFAQGSSTMVGAPISLGQDTLLSRAPAAEPQLVIRAQGATPSPISIGGGSAATYRPSGAGATPSPTSVGAPGAAVWQDHLSRPTARGTQRLLTRPEPAYSADHLTADSRPQAWPPISSGEGLARPQPALRQARRATEAWATVTATTDAGNLGTAILRRHLGSSVGRVIQRKAASPGPAQLEGLVAANLQPSIRASVPLKGDSPQARRVAEAPVQPSGLARFGRSKEDLGDFRTGEIAVTARQVTQPPQALILPKRMDNHTIDRVHDWHSQSAAGFAQSVEFDWPSPDAIRSNVETWEAPPTSIPLPASLPLVRPQAATLPMPRQREGVEGPLPINSPSGNVRSAARQTSPDAGATVENGAPEVTKVFTPAAARAPMQASEIDLGQLVEQVSRIIFRQLAVERERRGLGRWH